MERWRDEISRRAHLKTSRRNFLFGSFWVVFCHVSLLFSVSLHRSYVSTHELVVYPELDCRSLSACGHVSSPPQGSSCDCLMKNAFFFSCLSFVV